MSFPLIVWDDPCAYWLVLFWSDQKRITVWWVSWKEEGSAIVLDGSKGYAAGLRWHTGWGGGSQWFCWVPITVPPNCTDLSAVAYVLLDTVKKLSENGFILWSEYYFVIYDSVNGRKSIKCIKFFCLSSWSVQRKLVLGSGGGVGRAG